MGGIVFLQSFVVLFVGPSITAGAIAEEKERRTYAILRTTALSAPSLVRTKLGWHLVEVLERKAAEARSFEETREEIVAALEALKRDKGLRAYRHQLRNLEKNKVEVFRDALFEF